MFGIDDPWIWSAYLLSIGFAVFCAIYGFLRWNEEDE